MVSSILDIMLAFQLYRSVANPLDNLQGQVMELLLMW